MDDDFVPEGCLPLKSAIDRLVQARQTSVQSAQAEIRTKLHSGLIRAVVMRPGTGELVGIISDRWALDDAQDWLEQGECILTSDRKIANFTPGLLSSPHRARIFVIEDDLNRLIDARASQKSEPNETRLSAPSRAPRQNKGGRPPEYDWAAMRAFTFQQIQTLGRPHENNKRLPTKAQLIELIMKEWSDRYDQHPTSSTVRGRLDQWLSEIDEN
jgi:hypothetical protein